MARIYHSKNTLQLSENQIITPPPSELAKVYSSIVNIDSVPSFGTFFYCLYLKWCR